MAEDEPESYVEPPAGVVLAPALPLSVPVSVSAAPSSPSNLLYPHLTVKVLDATCVPSTVVSVSSSSSLRCAVWVGGRSESKDPDFTDPSRTQLGSCPSHMSPPRFDVSLVFPLHCDTLDDLLWGVAVVSLSDARHDADAVDGAGDKAEELGRVTIPLSHVLANGRAMTTGVHLSSRFYALERQAGKSGGKRASSDADATQQQQQQLDDLEKAASSRPLPPSSVKVLPQLRLSVSVSFPEAGCTLLSGAFPTVLSLQSEARKSFPSSSSSLSFPSSRPTSARLGRGSNARHDNPPSYSSRSPSPPPARRSLSPVRSGRPGTAGSTSNSLPFVPLRASRGVAGGVLASESDGISSRRKAAEKEDEYVLELEAQVKALQLRSKRQQELLDLQRDLEDVERRHLEAEAERKDRADVRRQQQQPLNDEGGERPPSSPSPDPETSDAKRESSRDPDRRRRPPDAAPLSDAAEDSRIFEQHAAAGGSGAMSPISPRPPAALRAGAAAAAAALPPGEGRKVKSQWSAATLHSLGRLADKDTLSVALGELHDIVDKMPDSAVLPFLLHLGKEVGDKGSSADLDAGNASAGGHPPHIAVRRAKLLLLQHCVVSRTLACSAPRCVAAILDMLHGHVRHPAASLAEDCAAAFGAVVRHVVPHCGEGVDIRKAVDGLFPIYSEQGIVVKDKAGECIAAAILPKDARVPLTIRGTIRSLEDLRHGLRFVEKSSRVKIPFPKDAVVTPSGSALLFSKTSADGSALRQALSAPGVQLPPGWSVEPLSEVHAYFLVETLRRHARRLDRCIAPLMADVVAAMQRTGSGGDASLFQSVSNVAMVKMEHGEKCPNFAKAIKQHLPQLLMKAVQALGRNNKKLWREGVAAADMIYWLCKCGGGEDIIDARYTQLLGALKSSKSGTVKSVRNSTSLAIEELNRIHGEVTKASGLEQKKSGDDDSGVAFHEINAPPPLKFVPDFEPNIDEGGEDDQRRARDEEDNDSVDGARNQRKDGDADGGDGAALTKKGKKRTYAYQKHKAGGVRSPRSSGDFASGSAHATVRLLKELGNKSVAMQRSLDDFAQLTREKMDTIGKRVKEIEAGVHAQPPPVEVVVPQPRQLTPKELFLESEGVDVRNGARVSLWRELQWLLHCGELETAYQTCLDANARTDLLRLMYKTGVVSSYLSPMTNNKLFTAVGEMILANKHVDHVLPWVFKLVQDGQVKVLAAHVKARLGEGLYALSSDPEEKGVLAAKLQPHF